MFPPAKQLSKQIYAKCNKVNRFTLPNQLKNSNNWFMAKYQHGNEDSYKAIFVWPKCNIDHNERHILIKKGYHLTDEQNTTIISFEPLLGRRIYGIYDFLLGR